MHLRGGRYRYRIAIGVLVVLMAAPFVWSRRSRKPDLLESDPSRLWPRYSIPVRRELKGRISRAYRRWLREDRKKAFAPIVDRVWQLVGGPEPSPEVRDRLAEVFTTGSELRIMRRAWYWANQVGRKQQRRDIPRWWRMYAEWFQGIDAWIEELAQDPQDPTCRLVEAIVAETDRVAARHFPSFAKGKSVKRKQMKPMRPPWDPALPPLEQPAEISDTLPELLAMYLIASRPDRQLDEHLDELGEEFGIAFTGLDVACAFARFGKTNAALRWSEDALAQSPRKQRDVHAYRRLALCFYQNLNRDAATAVQIVDDLLERSNGSALARAAAGECYERMRKYARAVANYRQAYDAGPEGPAGLAAIVKAADLEAFRLDSPESAADTLEEAVLAFPQGEARARAQLLLARIYGKLGRLMDMTVACETICIENPDSELAARMALAGAAELHKAGANDQAAKLLNERMPVLHEHGKEPRARLVLALVDLAKSESEAARAQLRAVLDSEPGDAVAARAWFLIGYSHMVVQEYAKAKEGFDLLCIKHPKSRWAKTAKKQYLPGLRKFVARQASE